MQPSIQTKVQIQDWNSNRRYRVRDTVQYRNAYWSNVTGINSEPSFTSTNWIFISEAVPYYNQLKITKHPNNIGAGLEVNDKVNGWRSPVKIWEEVYYMGGDPEEDESWDIVLSNDYSPL